MGTVGQATANGYAERVIRTIKEEDVYLSDYKTFKLYLQTIKSLLITDPISL